MAKLVVCWLVVLVTAVPIPVWTRRDFVNLLFICSITLILDLSRLLTRNKAEIRPSHYFLLKDKEVVEGVGLI
jgi:hypothetical protein